MADKKEPQVDHKVLDEVILKVLAYKPKKKDKPDTKDQSRGAAGRPS